MKQLSQQEIKKLVDTALKIMEMSKGDKKDPTYEINFLFMFIESMVTSVLSDKGPGKTKKNQFDYVKNNFAMVKGAIQESVALGFQEALLQYSKVPVEYYCVVKPVPETVSLQNH